MIAGLVNSGLAMARRENMKAGSRAIEVVRVRITEAGPEVPRLDPSALNVGRLKRRALARRHREAVKELDMIADAAPTLDQGNRVKKLCGDEACEKLVIPSGDLAPETEGILAWGSSDQVEGHVLDGGEVGGGVIGADAAFVPTTF